MNSVKYPNWKFSFSLILDIDQLKNNNNIIIQNFASLFLFTTFNLASKNNITLATRDRENIAHVMASATQVLFLSSLYLHLLILFFFFMLTVFHSNGNNYKGVFSWHYPASSQIFLSTKQPLHKCVEKSELAFTNGSICTKARYVGSRMNTLTISTIEHVIILFDFSLLVTQEIQPFN